MVLTMCKGAEKVRAAIKLEYMWVWQMWTTYLGSFVEELEDTRREL